MNEAYLIRLPSNSQGTYGVFLIPSLDFKCYSIELPWKNNSNSISCIPKGEYKVVLRWSKKYKYHFHVTDVDGRQWILFHSGNYAGDTSKGWKTHSKGCILLGKSIGVLNGQKAVLNSRITIKRLMTLLNKKTFKLKIL